MSPPPPPSAAAASSSHYFSALGLGYSIAIALAFLVLLSSLLLASYLCCRSSSHTHPSTADDGAGVILPRVIFVAEDDHATDLENDAAVGLDQAVINSYPKFPFTKDAVPAGDDAACSICLCDYRDLETLRMMPECRHYFHASCLDVWLKLNGSCPVCRNSPLPTPVSTPLQEVVPLAQYAADRRRRR